MSNLKKRIINGLGANSITQVINISLQVLSLPLFLKFWGVHLYGEWLILSTIPAYLAMAEIGFLTVAGNSMTIALAKSNVSLALEIFQNTWVFICFICLVIFVGLSFSALIPINILLNINLISNKFTILIIIFLGFGVICNLQTYLIYAALRAEGRYALGVWINNIFRIIELISLVSGLYMGLQPIDIALITSLCKLLNLIIAYLIIKKLNNWLVYGVKSVSFEKIKEMVSPSLAFMAFPIGNAMKNQGMINIVGVMLGPIAVVSFTAMRTLINSISQAMAMINNTIWPELSKAFGSGDIILARKLNRSACKLSIYISLILIGLLSIYGEDIVLVWSGGKVDFQKSFFNIMLIGMIINSIWYTASVVLASNNQHKKMAVIFLFGSVFTLVLAWAIVPLIGIEGSAISLLSADVLMVLYVVPVALKLTNDNIKDFIKFLLNLNFKRFHEIP